MERTSREFFASLVRTDAASLGAALENLTDDRDMNLLPVDNLLNVLELLTDLQIESRDFAKIGIGLKPHDTHYIDESSTVAYSVGSGYTCNVIRHELREDVGACTKGSIVAIKKFIPNPPRLGQDQLSIASEEFDTIFQELQALCHPSIRRHENIINVLFVGWEPGSSFPFLAMELAAYGSLEYVLTSTGFGMTKLQKCNLTIDVTLGLQALHRAGFLHGDIKTANIMVQRHSEREIIAKLSDFGGSVLADETQAPTMGTKLWWPPEVLFNLNPIDWKRVDVYTMGLVIASIWARPSTYLAKSSPSACILDKILATQLSKSSGQLKEETLAILKSEADFSRHSVLKQSLTQYDLVDNVLMASLSCKAANREEIDEIVKRHVCKLAKAINRDILPDEDHSSRLKTRRYRFKVWARSYRSRTREYKSLVFGRLLSRVQGSEKLLHAYSSVHKETDDISTLKPEEFLDFIQKSLKSIMEQVLKQFSRDWVSSGPQLAFQVAISYLLRLGTEIDEAEAAKWLTVACLGGSTLAVHMGTLGISSCSNHEDCATPWHLFLVLSALAGSVESMSMLRQRYPEYYQKTLGVIQSIRPKRSKCSGPYFIEALQEYRNGEYIIGSDMGLFETLESLNADHFHRLLRSGYDASIIDEEGCGVLHHLSLLEDETAATLAELCVEQGARLDLCATGSPPLGTSLPVGSPLSWAFTRNIPLLFEKLLSLHVQYGIPIPDHNRLLMIMACLDGAPMLSKMLTLKQESPSLFDTTFSSVPIVTSSDAQSLVSLALDPMDIVKFHEVNSVPMKTFNLQEVLLAAIYDNDWSMISRRARRSSAP